MVLAKIVAVMWTTFGPMFARSSPHIHIRTWEGGTLAHSVRNQKLLWAPWGSCQALFGRQSRFVCVVLRGACSFRVCEHIGVLLSRAGIWLEWFHPSHHHPVHYVISGQLCRGPCLPVEPYCIVRIPDGLSVRCVYASAMALLCSLRVHCCRLPVGAHRTLPQICVSRADGHTTGFVWKMFPCLLVFIPRSLQDQSFPASQVFHIMYFGEANMT